MESLTKLYKNKVLFLSYTYMYIYDKTVVEQQVIALKFKPCTYTKKEVGGGGGVYIQLSYGRHPWDHHLVSAIAT